MPEVFISYSSIDSVKAKDIVDRMEGAGISCWISQRDIPPGADYAIEIPKAITACECFVLLLTNAAQESPYVMLELDQAFKQKKVILPILLENVEENEKTNFFLNAKQKVDASQNVTKAVNEVISRIKPFAYTKHEVTEPKTERKEIQSVVSCPYCGCTILKRKRLFIDRFLYPKDGIKREDKLMVYILKHNESIGIICFIMAFVLLLLIIARLDNILLWIAVAGIEILLLLFLLLNQPPESNSHKIRKLLIDAINNTELKYYSFKCVECEKYFGVLLPKDKSLIDMTSILLEEKTEEQD